MRGSYELLFATSNPHKFREARAVLAPRGVRLLRMRRRLEEVQSASLRRVSRHKARRAFEIAGRPVIAEDDGLQVDSLGGFPGPYSSYALETIGCAGILRLVGGDRRASFTAAVSYCDGARVATFEHSVRGRIPRRQMGSGWGYDPVFVPDGGRLSFAQLDKSRVSHRAGALEKLARWMGRRGAPGAGR